jgi:2-dehydropantoate 2-reductase
VVIDGERERTVAINATADPVSVGVVDAVLVCVKCYSTESAIQSAQPMVGRDTVVASIQNGWGNGEIISQTVVPDRVVLGITYHSATVIEPGRVAHTDAGPTILGPFDTGSLTAAEQIGSALRTAGFDIDVTTDIHRQMWRKLTLNSADLPVAALTGLRSAGTAADPFFSVVEALARETMAVGQVLGFDFSADDEVARLRGVLTAAGEGKASMLQDVENGRRTEIDVINGAVVRLALEFGVPVPTNAVMYDLMKGYEQAHGLS